MIKHVLMGSVLVVAGFTSAMAGGAVSRPIPLVKLQKSQLSILVAGYVPIEQSIVCSGTPAGIIRIHVSEILKKLSNSKTIGKRSDINKIDVVAPSGEPDITMGARVKRPTKVNGFPTVFDIETVAIDTNGQDEILVDQNKFVIVRVILDKKANKNDNVRFLYPDQDDKNSTFAIMRTAGTDEKMFCNRADIDNSPDKKGNPRASIDFGIQSVGGPAEGGFGIGLLVIDSNGDQTPIILDPNVKNNG